MTDHAVCRESGCTAADCACSCHVTARSVTETGEQR